MIRVSALPRRAAWTLVAFAGSLMLPAFGATPAAPTISGYSSTNPRGAPITSAPPGTPVLIEGQNLGTSGTIAFNGVPAPAPASWSSTEILVTVPAAPSYPFTGPVTVTTNGHTAGGPAFSIAPPPPPIDGPGSLDPSFGTGGKVVTDFGGGAVWEDFLINAMAVQPAGRIVLAGQGNDTNGNGGFVLVRYHGDGSLDPSFGSGGKVLTDFGSAGYETSVIYGGAYGVAVQPDGRIVAAGLGIDADGHGFGLARYNGDGSLDTTFGSGGKVLTDVGGSVSDAGARAVALQADGRIVAAGGGSGTADNLVFALARYNRDGSLDSTFGSGGEAPAAFSGDQQTIGAYAVAVQPDGRIVVAGEATDADDNPVFALARYNGSGSLDPSFGSGGRVLSDFGGGVSDAAHAVALQPDGRIVAAGWGDNNWLARYNGDGSLDPSFGTGGQVLTVSAALSVALQADGRIIVAGDNWLARYNGNGTLDSSFGAGGAVWEEFGITAMAVMPDGQIVVAGGGTDGNGRPVIALARYRGR